MIRSVLMIDLCVLVARTAENSRSSRTDFGTTFQSPSISMNMKPITLSLAECEVL